MKAAGARAATPGAPSAPQAIPVNVAYYRLANIDPASGYDQLPRYLADKTQVRLLRPSLPTAVPAWLAARLGHSRHLSFYEPAGLGLEYAVLRRLIAAPGEVCHVMYAEDHFNHLALARHISRRRRGALVATFHQPPNEFERVVRFPHLRRRLGALDAAIVLSQEQARMLRRLMPEDRVHLVRHGVNAQHFAPPERRLPGPVRCLAVGSWLRDLDVLRETIERVAAAEPTIAFEVITTPAIVKRLRGASNTELRSELSSEQLRSAYHAAHLFLHPVREAAANNAILEAMACGLPVIATRTGGVPDYVEDGWGVLTPRGDAEAMSAAVLELARDASRRAGLGDAAREAALKLDWPHVAWQTQRVYAAALGQGGA